MKIKPQEKYKQLLINHYQFKEIDFFELDGIIYLNSKDNVGETARDVYEELVMQLEESYAE